MRRALAAALVLLAVAAVASAEDIRRLEVAGAAPAGEDAPEGVAPRDAALRSAVGEAVERVAEEMLGDGTQPKALPKALSQKPMDFVVRYRILEDRGERRALLMTDPGIETEYVVLAEVHVDGERVRRALAAEGLASSVQEGAHQFRVALEGVESWRVLAAVQAGLQRAGASRAVPVEIRPGETQLAVESRLAPEPLVEKLRAEAEAAGVEIRLIGVTDGVARVEALPLP